MRAHFLLGASLLALAVSAAAQPRVFHAQGEMTGEVTKTSAILQSRLTASAGLVDGDAPGIAGVARFEISEREDFQTSRMTDWLHARAETDFIVKTKVAGLKPGARIYYRLIFGANEDAVQTGETCAFSALQGKHGDDDVSFVVVTGMNYMSFHYGLSRNGKRTGVRAYRGPDKQLGFPALATLLKMKPDFFVGTGDNVYYDSGDSMHADTIKGMRRKWHEQFGQPRFVELFRQVPTYWEKDDHDHRYNDNDRTGDRPPSSDLGIRVFREQVPVVDPLDADARTYRTHRINRHLQIWLVEGRDYRSPNKAPDGPDKTLWGAEQIAWLKRTLSASDATFKILISPTPMVGPDDAYKTDNHTNHKGFRHEGRAFFRWIKEQQLDKRGFYVVCGDRHWQYHSLDPTGIEEFSSGALVDSNARTGRKPGDRKSTDPKAEIRQIYTQSEASGGFLKITVTREAQARFEFFDENGKRLYRTVKSRGKDLGVLEDDASGLLAEHLLEEIHGQYDRRRADVESALQSRDAMEARQRGLNDSLKRIMGELPEKTPLNARTTGAIEVEGYRIEKVIYESRPHHHVTANLYVPTRGKGPFPGVLIACGHSAKGKAYEPYQSAAALMALNGMVALVYDPIGQGERLSHLKGSANAGLQHKLDNVNSALIGRTAVGYQAWDGVRSLDYLLSRPEVDESKPVGMTGNSGGGAQTMYLMALDDRIGPAAPSCHITTLERNFDLGVAGDGCQSAPWTGAEGLDHPDFFAMRAPRPSIILSAERDYKDIQFTRKTFAEASRVYSLLGQPDRMDMFVHDDKHAFSRPRREAAAQWMRRWLLDDPRPVKEPRLTLQSTKALQATESGQTLREFSDALSVPDLNLRRARELAPDRKAFWNARERASALAEIRELIGAPKNAAPQGARRRETVHRGDCQMEKWVIRSSDGFPLPALHFVAHELPEKYPVTIILDGRGKAASAGPGGEVERLVRLGHAVLSVDLRGFGETADPPSKIIYVKGDHRASMWGMHIGRPLLGQRTGDALAALEHAAAIHGRNASTIHLIAVGQAGPVALHAGALDSRFESVTLRDSIRSWVEDVVAKPGKIDSISHIVPSALKKYDLPDLAHVLGDRLTVK
jgi:alkaline phosphatase D